MNILFFTDPHLRETGPCPSMNKIGDTGLTRELENKIIGYQFVKEQILSIKPQLVVCLGDTFHSQEVQTIRTLYAAHKAESKIQDACEQLKILYKKLMGNHDLHSESDNINSIEILKGYADIVSLDMIIEVFQDSESLENFTIAFIPYCNDTNMYANLIEAQTHADLICLHTGFAGARYESGHPADSQLSPILVKPAVCGHVHVPQDLGSVHFVGALVLDKFYTSNLDHVGSISVYNTITKKFTRIKNNMSKHFIRIYDAKDLPFYLSHKELKFAYQVFVDETVNREELNRMMKDQDWFPIPKINQQNKSSSVQFSSFEKTDPNEQLKTYVKNENMIAYERLENFINNGEILTEEEKKIYNEL